MRRLYPPRDDALPLYVQVQGASVGRAHGTLVVRAEREEVARARLKDTSQLVLCGNVGVSAQAFHLLCEAGIPVVHLSRGHWFYGVTSGINLRNAFDRAAQFRAADDPQRCLEFARALVADKIQNQRTMLRRNAEGLDGAAADALAAAADRAREAGGVDELLGHEGTAAAVYFQNFGRMLKPRDFDATWDFTARNRRPPRDPVNALLSFAHALLAKEVTVAVLAEGLDPWWGLFHRPRHGRPALALDLMEELRPLVADSAVLSAVNTAMVVAGDFESGASGCVMREGARKALIRAFEARLDQLVTHPVFEYRCSWRSVVRVQVRLFARWLRGDVPRYVPMTTK